MADGFNFQPIIQQYIPAPVQEFGALGNILQERYDTNLAAWDELDLLANSIQVAQGDTYIRDNAIKEMRNQLSEIEESGAWERARPMVREAVKRLRGDQALSKAAQNYQAIKKLQSDISNLRTQGKTPLVFAQDPSTFRTVGEDGTLNTFSGVAEEQLAYRPAAEKLFHDLEASTLQAQSRGVRMGPNGIIYNTYGSGVEGITDAQIQAVAAGNLAGFLQSNEGAQMNRANQQLRGMTAEESQEAIQNYLVNVGRERLFAKASGVTGTSYAGQMRSSNEGSGGGGGTNPWNSLRMVTTQTTTLGDDTKGQQLHRSVKNAFDPESPSRQLNEVNLMSRLQELSVNGTGEVKKAAAEQINFINDIKSKYPEKYHEILYSLEEYSGLGKDMKTFLDPRYIGASPGNSVEALREATEGNRKEAEEVIDKYFDIRKKYRTSNANFFRDSSFENAYQDVEKTNTIKWVKPDANFLKAEVRNTIKEGNSQLDVTQYNLIKSEDGKDKDLSNFKGKLQISESSMGALPGIGVVYQAIDDEGKKYIVRPKEDSMIESFADAWRQPQLKYLDDAARGGQKIKAFIQRALTAENSAVRKEASQELYNTALSLREGMNLSEEDIKELATRTGDIPINVNKLLELINKYTYGQN